MRQTERPPTTRLVIEPEKNIVEDREGNISAFGRDMTIQRKRDTRRISYYQLHNLSHTESVEVAMRDGEAARRINLPDAMLARLAAFMRAEQLIHQERYDFDCITFANFMNGIPDHDFNLKYWEVSAFAGEDTLVPGDTILLANPVSGSKTKIAVAHLAVYVGNEHYLSKAGAVGRLVAMRLPEMFHLWPCELLMQLRPKQRTPKTASA